MCSSQQIDQGKQDQPDQVDHVPEADASFQIGETCTPADDGKYDQTHDYMQGVKAGDQEKQRVEDVAIEPGAMGGLVGIFDALDHKEGEPKGGS